MIVLHQLNDAEFMLNAKLIETIKEAPDTTIMLTTGRLYIVKESMREVFDLIHAYMRSVHKIEVGDESLEK